MLVVFRTLGRPRTSWSVLVKGSLRQLPKYRRHLAVLAGGGGGCAVLLHSHSKQLLAESFAPVETPLNPASNFVCDPVNNVSSSSKTSWLQDVIAVIKILFRTVQMAVMFTPLLVSAPFALYIDRLKDPWFRLLVKTIQECGPVYIKLGQWASTRRDLFPTILCNHLSSLQRRVNTHPWRHTQALLEENFGNRVLDIFESFEETPVGSGCCAQVYKAKCRYDVRKSRIFE